MNAQQGKALIQASEQVLHMLQPKYAALMALGGNASPGQFQRITTIRFLSEALEAAHFPPVKTPIRRNGKIDQGKVWRDAEQHLARTMTDADKAAATAHARAMRTDEPVTSWTMMIARERESFASYKRRVLRQQSICTCAHKYDHHIEDRDGNLLHCRHCECDHFRSPVIDVAA